MVRVTLKWFKITTISCEPATLEGKNIFSPFCLIHQIILPMLVLHTSKKKEVFVSTFPFIYSSVPPRDHSLTKWKLPLETLQHHVKSHNQLLPYHTQLWKTRDLSYKRTADMLHMVFHSLCFFFSEFFNPT